MTLTSSATLAEGFNLNGTGGALNLAFTTSTAPEAAANALLQNMPNPVVDVTTIRFTLAQSGPATLTLRDVSGRLLREIKIDAISGWNSVELRDLEVGGVIRYTLVAGDFFATRKMVVVR